MKLSYAIAYFSFVVTTGIDAAIVSIRSNERRSTEAAADRKLQTDAKYYVGALSNDSTGKGSTSKMPTSPMSPKSKSPTSKSKSPLPPLVSEKCFVYEKIFDSSGCCGQNYCEKTANIKEILCPGPGDDFEEYCAKISPSNSDSTGCPCFPGCYLGCIAYAEKCCSGCGGNSSTVCG